MGAGAGGAMEGRAAGGWQCMRFGDGVRLRGMRGVMVCRDLSPRLDQGFKSPAKMFSGKAAVTTFSGL